MTATETALPSETSKVRCANHPTLDAKGVCQRCGDGYCRRCQAESVVGPCCAACRDHLDEGKALPWLRGRNGPVAYVESLFRLAFLPKRAFSGLRNLSFSRAAMFYAVLYAGLVGSLAFYQWIKVAWAGWQDFTAQRLLLYAGVSALLVATSVGVLIILAAMRGGLAWTLVRRTSSVRSEECGAVCLYQGAAEGLFMVALSFLGHLGVPQPIPGAIAIFAAFSLLRGPMWFAHEAGRASRLASVMFGLLLFASSPALAAIVAIALI